MRNKYIVRGSEIEIFLSSGDSTIIDEDDFEKVNAFSRSWWLTNRGYVVVRRVDKTGSKVLLMSRVIMNVFNDMVVDHINGNPLDNRKSNLRVITQAQNTQNVKTPKTNKSGYRGVWFCEKDNKWLAQVKSQNKNHVIRCNSKEEAIEKVKELRQLYHPYSWER